MQGAALAGAPFVNAHCALRRLHKLLPNEAASRWTLFCLTSGWLCGVAGADARQLQGWMVQRASTGQFFSAPANRLELKPQPAHGNPNHCRHWQLLPRSPHLLGIIVRCFGRTGEERSVNFDDTGMC